MPTRKVSRKKNPYDPLVSFGGTTTVTVGAENTNAINVAIVVKDGYNQVPSGITSLEIYLSDSADGSTLAASAPTGGWAIGTNGLKLVDYTANKHGKFMTKPNTGQLDITITESSAKTFYMVMMFPSGHTVITPITFA